MLMYVGHLVSLSLYVFVVATCLSMFMCIMARKVKLPGYALAVVITFITSLTLQASTFIGLQIDWIFMDYNNAVGDVTAYAWLAYDYFNGFALLSYAVALRIFLLWRTR